MWALHLFQEKGYAGVSIRDLTGPAQVTPSTLYHHFKDKKNLYKATVIYTLEGILIELQEAGRFVTFEHQLIALLSTFYRHRHANVGAMLHEMATNENFEVSDLQEVGDLVNGRWRKVVERLVRQAIKDGELKPGNIAFYTQIIFDTGFGFARSPLGNWTGWSEEQRIKEVAKLLLTGFGVEKFANFI